MRIEPHTVQTVVMAGGVNRIPLYEGYVPGYKALVELGGRPCIQYPLRALRASRYVRDICVVGSQSDLSAAVGDPDVVFTPGGASFLESVIAALSFYRDREVVLATTADLPLLSADIVDTFVEACAAAPTSYEANIYVSAVPQEKFTGPFAQVAKIMPRFRDGAYCHGNLMMAQPKILDSAVAMERLNALYAGRKGAFSSALALGPGVGLAFVLGVYMFHVVTMARMAAIASRRFRIGIVPVPMAAPEIALDVDDPADYRLVKQILADRSGAAS
jgi:GTP:adenosylcobinamide-phosphate guanylyltransferase